MIDSTIILWAINLFIVVVCYFFKIEHKNIKDRIDLFEKELKEVKDKYFKKEDFTEFKKELWARFDRMEEDFKQRIQELRK